ncbi:MAG: hypothetical protein LUE09_00100 [Synergistaceae bacterium]|nr:hypothetical protein [Synergistaceae bacterium]
MANALIGTLSAEIKILLSLPYIAGAPILIGSGNITHMKARHPEDYAKYGADIASIIMATDYVGVSAKDHSIEYIKQYAVNVEYVKVAVIVSNSGVLFVRSLYVISETKIYNFIKSGTLKQLSSRNP